MHNDAPVVYCFPFAGGAQYCYRDLAAFVPAPVRLVTLEPPGRGKRTSEPLLTDLNAVARDAHSQIMRCPPTDPYALFGHSMGAYVAYLVLALLMRDETVPPPAQVFVSGRGGPSAPRSEKPWNNAPRNEFVKKLSELGGASAFILEDPAMMEYFEPIIRADVRAVEAHVHEPTGPFDVPFTVMIGRADNTTKQEALAWQAESVEPIRLLQYNGGHFFIFDHGAAIGGLFAEALIGHSLKGTG